MTYNETIEYLFSRLPMFSRSGVSALRANLTNTKKIVEFLGHPEQKIRAVHVAGTNGKGSVSHMLAAVFQECGYKTGLYTSPHLKDFRERVKIDGEMIAETQVIDFTGNIKSLIEEIKPSFFEITVGLAFDFFAKQQVDLAIVETGLGGRLDSTNIINPNLSVITNISYDHMNILGETLQEIASEKAGIIKKNVPVVVGERSAETEDVFISAARFNSSELVFADEQYFAENWDHKDRYLYTQIVSHHSGDHTDYRLDLPGYYQIKNLITTLAAIDQLRKLGWHLPNEKIIKALSAVKKLTGLHGRWEQLRSSPALITDVAHNEAGVAQLLAQLELSDHGELHLVYGVVKDKEVDNILNLLPKEARYYFTQSNIPRALPAGQLQAKAEAIGLKGDTYPDVNTAVKAALGKASSKDLILVFGSVYLVGELNY